MQEMRAPASQNSVAVQHADYDKDHSQILSRPMHIHIDPLDGLAGDMFVAAVLDAWPHYFDGLEAAVRAAGVPPGVTLRFNPHSDHALTGGRFLVELSGELPAPAGAYRDIVSRLGKGNLYPTVRDHTLAIMALLAGAKGKVHGVAPEDVVFHELAGWDSIAEIVAAAYLIDQLGAASWSVAPLPLGRGRVMTAHGPLPNPATATAILLEELPVMDDGIEGERVTPTGAAILRHLNPSHGAPATPMRLDRSGYGFGARKFDGISNAVHLLVFETATVAAGQSDQIGVITFEVDDQTPEDLAVGLDVLRGRDGVLDVVRTPAFGKKGRMVMSVRVLCRPESLSQVVDACFTETTTIGLRWGHTMRSVLPRRMTDGDLPVKVVAWPDGRQTAKAEMDGVATRPGQRIRTTDRQRAETSTLKNDEAGSKQLKHSPRHGRRGGRGQRRGRQHDPGFCRPSRPWRPGGYFSCHIASGVSGCR